MASQTNAGAAPVVIPEEYVCVITQKLMEEAVVDPDGTSYSKKAIEDWLDRNATSPVTRKPLRKQQLVPNRALRELIDKWAKENNYTRPAAEPTPEPAANEVTIAMTTTNDRVLYSVTPPAAEKRLPASIVCVIDISGSMDSLATVKDEDGKTESHGLSQLDIVKHAVKTIIHCLGDEDSLSLISFSTQAKTELKATKMTKNGKATAVTKLDSLSPTGTTNLWDGLYQGLEALRACNTPIANASIMLFTDGMPNVVPPRGHLPMLQRYKDEFGLPGSIDTFGFGYSLDSKLLEELALEGSGTYGFIPDASLVGTVFVNAVSNHLSKCAKDVVLNVEETKTARLADSNDGVLGAYQYTRTSWGVSIRLGSLCYGQAKDVVVAFDSVDPSLNTNTVSLSYTDLKTNTQARQGSITTGTDQAPLELHNLRLQSVDVIRSCCEIGNQSKGNEAHFNSAKAAVEKMVLLIKESPAAKVKQAVDLAQDLAGQVTEGLEPAAFNRWGKHFLPSLYAAHLHQQCNNFKDPGVQHYGGKLFKALRDVADDIFVKLPQPQPKPKPVQRGGYCGATTTARAHKPVNMGRYYTASGGCFGGACLIEMEGGELKKAEAVRRGDFVETVEGPAEVLCVVRSIPTGGKLDMVTFDSGLSLTPFHPMVAPSGGWAFPVTLAEPAPTKASAVYDFVLSNGHTVNVHGTTCVTLGHSFADPVVSHPYFGSPAVVSDLEASPGYAEGIVDIHPHQWTRDPSTGLINGLSGLAA